MNASIDLHIDPEDAIRAVVGKDPHYKWISVAGRVHLHMTPEVAEALRDACSEVLQMYEDEATPHGMARVSEPLALELERLTAERTLRASVRSGTHG